VTTTAFDGIVVDVPPGEEVVVVDFCVVVVEAGRVVEVDTRVVVVVTDKDVEVVGS